MNEGLFFVIAIICVGGAVAMMVVSPNTYAGAPQYDIVNVSEKTIDLLSGYSVTDKNNGMTERTCFNMMNEGYLYNCRIIGDCIVGVKECQQHFIIK